MSMGSSQQQTSSTQPYIMSGPTVKAANEAAQAQVQAAQIAAAAATQNTQSAINMLMGEYSTALTYAQPAINSGNQALAQFNYMLGLPAVNPGPAPHGAELNQTPLTSDSIIAQVNNDFRNSVQIAAQAHDQWQKQEDIYNQYSAKPTLSSADISNVVTNLPGFQFAQNQGISAIENAASAKGQLNSGNLLQALNKFGQDQSQGYYQNYMGNLLNEAGVGQQGQQLVAQGAGNLGNSLSSAYQQLGNTQANSALAQGQAMASSFLSPVDNQKVSMTPYTTTSSSSGSSMSGGLGMLGSIGGMFASGGLFNSSRELKTSFGAVKTEDILTKVDQLDIDRWSYIGTDRKHMGPYAEDFKELFGVGDGKTINMIDLFGVLLGSIKELSQQVKELQGVKDGR